MPHRLSMLIPALLLALTGTTPAVPAHATGLHSLDRLPDGVREIRRVTREGRTDVVLQLPQSMLAGLDEATVEALHRWAIATAPTPPAGKLHTVVVSAEVAPGQVAPLAQFVPKPIPVPPRSYEPRTPNAAPVPGPSTVVGAGQDGIVNGSLSGKHVYLSPGHGFTWTQALGRWATQRGNTHELVEDLLNAEAALHYLVPQLWNAGARVVTLRERDLNPDMALVDDGDGTKADGSGYVEAGSAKFQPGTDKGFAGGKAPYQGDANPFALGSYRAVACVQGATPSASARFVPDLPTTARYAVYLGYTAGGNRVTDAHVEVRHLGGKTHLRIDQSKHGQTWVYLGHYAFQGGVHPETSGVWLHNDTAAGKDGKYLIADVVRFGGGMGDIARGTGKPPAAGPTSLRPRWEESCRTYAQFSGAPAAVYDSTADDPSDDVSCRSRMSAWDHENGEDAIYLSWHTNAPSPARGTSTYVYGPNKPDGTYQFTGTKGSDAFGKLVQKFVVDDIRKLWDPNWKDRGLYSAYFGEINPSHNPEMPAVLVEAAFHSTKEDADQLREPRFRHLLARALYKSIAKYFADRDKLPLHLLPEPPADVALQRTGPGKAQLTWQPGPSGGAYGDKADSYVVQLSSDGLGFAQEFAMTGTSAPVDLPAGATPVFARVVAVNLGGRSLPSLTVGAVEGCAGAPRALVVEGFTRLDSFLAPYDDLAAYDLGKVQRLRQLRMNTFDYAVAHVQALAQAGLGVDSAERGAVTAAVLGDRALVYWAGGEQSTTDVYLASNQRKLLADWLQSGPGRALWLDGSEVAWALDENGGAGGGDWLQTWFGARFESDAANVQQLQPAAGSAVAGGPWDFSGKSQLPYDVQSADVLKLAGGVAVLAYAGGKGIAAVRKDVPGGARTLVLGVPLECVYPSNKRLELMQKLLAAAGPSSVACATPVDAGGDAGAAPDTAMADAGLPDTPALPESVEVNADASGDGRSPELAADGFLAAAADAQAAAPAQADPGCGCKIAESRRSPSVTGPVALVLVLALGWVRRRAIRA